MLLNTFFHLKCLGRSFLYKLQWLFVTRFQCSFHLDVHRAAFFSSLHSPTTKIVCETRQSANEAEEIFRFIDFVVAVLFVSLNKRPIASEKITLFSLTLCRFYNEQIVEHAYQFPCIPQREKKTI